LSFSILIGFQEAAGEPEGLLLRVERLGTHFGVLAANPLVCLQLSFLPAGLYVSPCSSNASIISKKSNVMMTALFILSICVFVYLLYVLLKPEKF
jgi:K+-transporting ATPase KdpF subunit